MEKICDQKVHFAPFVRQKKAIERLLGKSEFRNVTEFMRAAIDHYLDNLGRPPLSVQARQIAEEYAESAMAAEPETSYGLQNASMATDEEW